MITFIIWRNLHYSLEIYKNYTYIMKLQTTLKGIACYKVFLKYFLTALNLDQCLFSTFGKFLKTFFVIMKDMFGLSVFSVITQEAIHSRVMCFI